MTESHPHRQCADGSTDEPGEPRSTASLPRVTIGLAVYNGERFLEEALESIVAQTFADFELVICDNASTDSTPEICRRFATLDARIRYFRNPANIGGVRNENRSMFLARGEYFKLAAHDDKVAPDFLKRTVGSLDAHPEAEVCTTSAYFIDGTGTVAPVLVNGKRVEVRAARAGTESRPHHRLRSIARWSYACEASYGLMRTSALREVRPQTNHLHSDRVLLTELALRQPFLLLEEPLFYKRIHEGNRYKDWRGRMAWFQPELAVTGKVRLPHWQQAADYVAMLGRARLGVVDGAICALELLRCFWGMRRDLALDLVDAVGMLLRGRRKRRERYLDEERWR